MNRRERIEAARSALRAMLSAAAGQTLGWDEVAEACVPPIASGKVRTTDATVTTLMTFAVATDTQRSVGIRVEARDLTNAERMVYEAIAVFKNVAGTVTQIDTTTEVKAVKDDASWAVTLVPSGEAVNVRVALDATNNTDCEGDVWPSYRAL